MKPPLPNSYWVRPGSLLAGEHPAGESDADTRKRIAKLLESGIDCFIDLTQPRERPDYRNLLPPTVRYHNLPLVDHGIPDNPQRMRSILTVLDQSLRAGNTAYVHCRAGIGRTGITIGCHLVEQGERGSRALETLNALWKQNARSRRWPRVPETSAQESYILHWQPVVAQALDLQSRARGALLGLALGDALSAPTQGLGAGEFRAVAGMLGDSRLDLAPGTWTDDTAMALCVAESFIDVGVFDARDQMGRYRRWQQEGHLSATGVAVGIRPAVRKALALSGWRRTQLVGSHDPRQLDAEPLGRCIAPALFYHRDFDAAVAAGADTARVTHQAPLVVDACRLFTGMLWTVLNGKGRLEAVDLARQWRATPTLKPELGLLAEGWRAPAGPAMASVPTILTVLDDVGRVFASGEDFATGALRVVNLGGDSDVAGAAYGQLCGALQGTAGLPGPWLQSLADAPRLERFADQLLKGPGV